MIIFKKGFILIQFDEQLDYALYIYHQIIKQRLSSICYCGLTEDLIYDDIRIRIKDYTYESYENWKGTLKPYIVIKRMNKTENRKEYRHKKYLEEYERKNAKKIKEETT